MSTERKRRANGDQSRQKIVEAATEIAGERGYDGTSISAVSERSGLPASSIYWHFKDKDGLIAAVIEHSFEQWRMLMVNDEPPKRRSATDAVTDTMRSTGRALVGAPDFLRLGLMLTLQHRSSEATARTMFLDIRQQTRDQTAKFYRQLFGASLDDAAVDALALMAMAATDGLFIAREIEGDELDVEVAFELIGVALAAVAKHLRATSNAN
jgi:AcrR family transcriptional regulator